MSTQLAASKFWLLVRLCLTDLYEMPNEKAALEVKRLSASSKKGRGPQAEAIYHAQPIHVASNVVRSQRPIDDAMWERYQKLIKQSDLSGKTYEKTAAEKISVKGLKAVRAKSQPVEQKLFAGQR